MKDIYFEENYGKMSEKLEDGVCEVFDFKCSYGLIRHMFIKRDVPFKINNKTYYDLITPYGYGGPIIIEHKPGFKNNLIDEFNKSFKQYCESNNIICEFIRFHPLMNNALDFESIYQIENIRKTVGTNIKDYEDPISIEFSKSAKKTIRKVLSLGVTYNIIEKPNNLDKFIEIYYSTMDRKHASDFYYFDKNYFSDCLKYFKDNIILVEAIYNDNVIASGLYFIYNRIIHVHLSGTLNEFISLSPAYILKYATVLWAKEHDIEIIHYGGGTSNSENDPLYQFKRKFGQNTSFDFYIGKKIWNKDVYDKACIISNTNHDSQFFPLYRFNK